MPRPWRIPWTEEPGRLQSMGSQRVRHDRATNTFMYRTVKKYLRYSAQQNNYGYWFNGTYSIGREAYIKNESESEVTRSCPTLCDPMDYSLPGSSILGIFQARILEWVAISLSRGSSWPGDRTWVSHIAGRCFYLLSHEGSPQINILRIPTDKSMISNWEAVVKESIVKYALSWEPNLGWIISEIFCK